MMFYRNFHALRLTCLFIVMTGFFLLSSCMKKEVYPDIPVIAFQDFTLMYGSRIYPDSGLLTISFKDGDGDIGLRTDQKAPPFDTGSIYYYNYIIDYYEKQNGTFVKRIFDTASNSAFNSRIPYLTPNDPNKAIKGIIENTLDFHLMPAPVYDTIKLKFYIYDRALHKSNVDSTPPIILRRQ
jgi:hypothetical protein